MSGRHQPENGADSETQKERLSPDAPAALAGSSLGRAADRDDSTAVKMPPTGQQPVDTDTEQPAIQFLRKRIADGMPLYQGDVDSALAEARLPLLQEIGNLHRALAAERQVGAASAASGGLEARAVWQAWYDGMTMQGRGVAPERQSWDTLPEQDKRLDAYIASRLRTSGGLDVLEAFDAAVADLDGTRGKLRPVWAVEKVRRAIARLATPQPGEPTDG